MAISILDMGNTKKRNVRESIISILSREYPLSIRKIYTLVKKDYKLDVTYQAVFKLVKEMLADNILQNGEDKMEYQLNIGWIKSLEQEVSNIKANYSKKEETNNEDKQGIGIFVNELGPKLKSIIGEDNCILFGISGGGRAYAFALWNYLKREGCKINYEDFDKFQGIAEKSLSKLKKELKNSQVIVVDRAVYSGEIFHKIMKDFNKLKDEFKIKDIKFVVDEDRPGLADICRKRIN